MVRDGRPAVAVRSLEHRYASASGDLVAIDRVDLHVADGEFVALVGPSGCGKTTLLRAVAGLLDPSDGSIEVLGVAPSEARRRRAIGFVAQEPGLLPWRTVEANVRLTLELSSEQNHLGRVQETLERVGMSHFASFHPRELSGGMRQRVALARALAHRPPVLLMDEPFGALDELSREDLCFELLRVLAQEAVSVLFVTHSIHEAVLLADRVIVMTPSPGRIAAEIPIPLPRPRLPSVQDAEAFSAVVRQVRAALGRVPQAIGR